MRPVYATCVERVKGYYDKWWPLVDMPHITVTLRFHKAWAQVDGNESHDIVMTTQCEYEYREALVEIYLPKASTLKAVDLEHCFVHELCHIINAPIRNEIEDTVKLETATENMARALVKAHSA